MSTGTQVNWDSVAPRANADTVNWDSVAPRADTIPEQSLGAAASEFGHQMNPVTIAKGIWQTVRHPIDTAKAYLDAKQQMVSDAEESLSKGDWGGFVRHMQTAAFPLPGIDVAVEQASNKWDSGDKAGALGDAAALVSQLAIAPRIPGALKATGRGITAAAPDVLAGGAKVAAGEALAKLPGMEFPARIAMGYPGARQIARGLGKGASAAFGGGEAEEPVGAATKAAPAAAAKTPGQILAEQDGKTWAKVPKAEKQVYEQIAQFKPKYEANVAEETASQQAVPRGIPAAPAAAEAPPSNPTPSAPESAQPASAAAPVHTIPANKFEPAVGGEDPAAINAYRQQIRNGQEIPPVEAAYHPSTGKLNVIDGYHRLAAYRAEGQPVKVTISNADEFPNEVQSLSSSSQPAPAATPEPAPISQAEDIAIQRLQRGQGLTYNEAAQRVRAQPAPAPEAQTPADIAKAATAKAKGERFIAAIQRYNIDFPERQPITAKGLDAIKDDDHAKSVLTQALKSGGYLNNFEKFTDTSFPYIVQGLRDAESGGNLAQQLAESIRRARANRASAGR